MTHLRLCQNYQVHLRAKRLALGLPSGPPEIVTISATPDPSQRVNTPPPTGTQATISKAQRIPLPALHQLSTEEKHQLHLKAALAVYMSGQPFSLLENQYMHKYQIGLLQLASIRYQPPGREALATTLLTEHFLSTKQEVEAILQLQDYLNIVFDASEDISGNRVQNISIVTPQGAFYYATDCSGSVRENAASVHLWATKKIEELVGPAGWWRVNSIITDTCSTMRAVWRLFNRDPKTQHIFTIPCESHGLQLLVKDVLEHEPFFEIISNAQKIATHFKKSKLQLAILREHQQELYGRQYAFCLAVITRWGTQERLIASVYKSKEALKAFIQDSRVRDMVNGSLRNLLLDNTFWSRLEEFRPFLACISKPQQQSEKDSAHIGQVRARWRTITADLHHILENSATLSINPSFDLEYICGERETTQSVPLHLLADFLNPSYAGPLPTESEWGTLIQLLERFENLHLRPGQSRLQLANYIHRTTPFSLTNPAWTHSGNPLAFWAELRFWAPELGALAMRIFSTPATSVPSERAFSTQNIIHDKKRSTLSQSSTNMLSYIHVNRRLLDRKKDEIRTWYEMEDSELALLEMQMIADTEDRPSWVY